MYKHGDLMATKPKCESWNEETKTCGNFEHEHSIIDNRDGKEYSNVVFLPHSCSEWVIGGPDEMKVLINDLQELRDRFYFEWIKNNV